MVWQGCLKCVSRLFGGFGKAVKKVFGGCLECVRRLSGGCGKNV